MFLILLIILLFFLISKKDTINVLSKYDNEKVIYIDPGHGGKDGGGISSTGVYEKHINLSISYYLKSLLENSGYVVKMTRYSDYDLASYNSKNRKQEDITKRIKLVNDANTLLFVSIHCNIYTSSSIRGAQSFYNGNNKESERLSNKIQSKLKTILQNTNRESNSITGKYLIDNSSNVGCLVEVGFLSNNDELALLVQNSYQQQLAYAIYLGIIDYLSV